MDTIRLISIIILIIAFVFIVAEFFTDEVEFFSPAAAITMIAGLVTLFYSEPQEWFGLSDQAYRIFTGLTITVGITAVALSAILFIKVRNVKELPIETNQYVGKEAKVLTPIVKDAAGYVQFEGAKWKAYSVSNDEFRKDEKVLISGVDGIKLIIRKL